MSSSLHRLIESIDNLEEIINAQSQMSDHDLSQKIEGLQAENQDLKYELDKLKKEYQILKETSKDIMNELNNSIEVIEDYFKKQNADNKNIKS